MFAHSIFFEHTNAIRMGHLMRRWPVSWFCFDHHGAPRHRSECAKKAGERRSALTKIPTLLRFLRNRPESRFRSSSSFSSASSSSFRVLDHPSLVWEILDRNYKEEEDESAAEK